MKLSIIVAHDLNHIIGNSKSNDIPWHLPPDLKRFQQITIGHPIIMGKNTYLSLPKRPLPKRKNIVITHYPDELGLVQNEFENVEEHEALSFSDLTRAIIYCESWLKAEEAFVIGGGRLYEEAMKKHHIDTIYRTLVMDQFQGDVKFPKINEELYQLAEQSEVLNHDRLQYRFDKFELSTS